MQLLCNGFECLLSSSVITITEVFAVLLMMTSGLIVFKRTSNISEASRTVSSRMEMLPHSLPCVMVGSKTTSTGVKTKSLSAEGKEIIL